jgi:hypothetical protein
MIRETATPSFDYIATSVDIETEMNNIVNEAKLLAAYVKENSEAMNEPHLIESQWFSLIFPSMNTSSI